jgi:quinol---cytochrome c reductase iron-sulfur subunit, bacillus type
MSDSPTLGNRSNRRNFIVKLLSLFGALLGALVAVPIIGAMVAPMYRRKSEDWRAVGKVDSFEVGSTVLVKFKNTSPLPWSGVTSQTASWLRRVSGDNFIAFSVNCSHLGCPVRWIPSSQLFLCPCHGGVYNKDGSYASGPPPHGLSRYPVRVRNNQVEILSSPIPITTI